MGKMGSNWKKQEITGENRKKQKNRKKKKTQWC
jgi:hypothetical protein